LLKTNGYGAWHDGADNTQKMLLAAPENQMVFV
jgi:hypothetical protein